MRNHENALNVVHIWIYKTKKKYFLSNVELFGCLTLIDFTVLNKCIISPVNTSTILTRLSPMVSGRSGFCQQFVKSDMKAKQSNQQSKHLAKIRLRLLSWAAFTAHLITNRQLSRNRGSLFDVSDISVSNEEICCSDQGVLIYSWQS